MITEETLDKRLSSILGSKVEALPPVRLRSLLSLLSADADPADLRSSNVLQLKQPEDIINTYADLSFIARQMPAAARRRLPDAGRRAGIVRWYCENWQTLQADARPDFDASYYLESNQDVAETGVEPFTHFVKYGFAEGRRPHPLIFPNFVRQYYGLDVDDIGEFFERASKGAHFNALVSQEIPASEWRSLLAQKDTDLSEYFFFDYTRWISAQPDVLSSYERHPIDHLFRYGLLENRLTGSGALSTVVYHSGRKGRSDYSDYDMVAEAEELMEEASFDNCRQVPSRGLSDLGKSPNLTDLRSRSSEDIISTYADLSYILKQMPPAAQRRLPDAGRRAGIVRWYCENWRAFEVDARPEFDSGYYRESNQDIAETGAEPFTHFVKYGFAEGRRPHPLIFPNFIMQYYGLDPEDIGNFFDKLSKGAHLNALVSREIPAAEWRCLLSQKDTDLSEYFFFDYKRWISAQEDVHNNYERHPIDHLFRYGLLQNRLTGSGAVSTVLYYRGMTATSDHSDHAMVANAGALMEEVSFDKLQQVVAPHALASGARLAIGVVYYNNCARDVQRLLRSILFASENQGLSIEYHALDNSDSADVDLFRLHAEILSTANLDSCGANIGFSRGHNLLMEKAFSDGVDYYVGLNPDGFLLRDALTNAAAFSRLHRDDALIEIGAFPIDHPKWYHPVTGESAWASGAAFMMPRRIYEAVGAFDPEFPMYGEDVDLSFRVRLAGFKVRVCPQAKFYHDITPRFDHDDGGRKLRQLIGNWYLCKKWGNEERAKALLHEIFLLGGSDARLPSAPRPLEPSPDMSLEIDFPRYAPSRFWGE